MRHAPILAFALAFLAPAACENTAPGKVVGGLAAVASAPVEMLTPLPEYMGPYRGRQYWARTNLFVSPDGALGHPSPEGGVPFIPAGTPLVVAELHKDWVGLRDDIHGASVRIALGRSESEYWFRHQLALVVSWNDPAPELEKIRDAIRQEIASATVRPGMVNRHVFLAWGRPDGADGAATGTMNADDILAARTWSYAGPRETTLRFDESGRLETVE